MVLLLAVVGVGAANSSPSVTEVPVPQLGASEPAPDGGSATLSSQPPPPRDPGPEHTVALPHWVGTALSALCVTVVVVVVGLLIWALLRDRLSVRRSALRFEQNPQAPQARHRDEVVAAVDAGLSDLRDDDADPRRAVIACWVRLEQAAAAAGTPRQPGDTSTDLVRRLLAAHQVSAGVLDDLAGVYRLARYATHTVDPSMRDRARTALRHLRAELVTDTVPTNPSTSAEPRSTPA
ncbi:MAG TPA: DUF4129 domain-containing protein [Micromonosporaceae bacterium]